MVLCAHRVIDNNCPKKVVLKHHPLEDTLVALPSRSFLSKLVRDAAARLTDAYVLLATNSEIAEGIPE